MQTMMRSPSAIMLKSPTASPTLRTMARSSLEPNRNAPSWRPSNSAFFFCGGLFSWTSGAMFLFFTLGLWSLGGSKHALEGIPRLLEARNQLGHVLGAAGLEGEIDGGLAEEHTEVCAIVGDRQDVGARGGDDAGEGVEAPGEVGDAEAQADQAAVLLEAALDDAREEVHVDV